MTTTIGTSKIYSSNDCKDNNQLNYALCLKIKIKLLKLKQSIEWRRENFHNPFFAYYNLLCITNIFIIIYLNLSIDYKVLILTHINGVILIGCCRYERILASSSTHLSIESGKDKLIVLRPSHDNHC